MREIICHCTESHKRSETDAFCVLIKLYFTHYLALCTILKDTTGNTAVQVSTKLYQVAAKLTKLFTIPDDSNESKKNVS